MDGETRRGVLEAQDKLTRLGLELDSLRATLDHHDRRLELLEAALGLEVRRPGRDELRAEVIRLRERGFSIRRIMLTLGISRTTTYRLLSDAPGLQMPPYIVTSNGKRYPSKAGSANGHRLVGR